MYTNNNAKRVSESMNPDISNTESVINQDAAEVSRHGLIKNRTKKTRGKFNKNLRSLAKTLSDTEQRESVYHLQAPKGKKAIH